ncbi:hypothetical protein Clacol_002474 [Clathrus columnatus]|uniref:Uncharacterized protein n=1 Tax=Clathrus columnatus TaxID=1419009 RepID=A0AAV5A0Y0_9AGAM|nr:hypothetical protein Clacol_002474 [Clathrus columnatus]
METADLGLGDHLVKDCKNNNLRTSAPNGKLSLESVATPSSPACSRKRKVDHQDAIECCPTPVKRRFEARTLINELETEGGRFLCWCSEWIPLKNGTRVSLEHWEKHFLTCQHLKAKGITSFEDILSTAMEELDSPEIKSESDIESDNESLLPLVPVDAPGISEKEEMELSDRGRGGVACADNTRSVQDTVNGEDNRPQNSTELRSSVQSLLKKRRPNRTEAERVQDFLDDPQVKELEPDTTARRSHNATPIAGTSQLAPSTQGETASLNSSSPQPTVDVKVPPANTHPSLQISSLTLEQPCSSKSTCNPKTRRPRLTDAENRKAVLEADLNAASVEPHRVLCALCKKWVKLRPNSTYCSAPWQNHIRRCMAKLDKKALKAQSNGNESKGLTVNPSEDELILTAPANQMTSRRRGRPSKNHVAQKPDENNSESDGSYESEEE